MVKYFLELKNRFLLIIITWLSVVIICYFYKETLLFVIVTPDIFTNFDFTSPIFYFIFTNITEIFSVYIQLIVFLSIQVSFFYLIYQGFVFLSPAFFQKEYYYCNIFLQICVSVWLFSIILSNYLLIPLTWNFFLSFQALAVDRSVNIHFEAKLNEYLSLYISLCYLCIFYCQIFTIFFFVLNYLNTNPLIIKKFRKVYYYFFVLFSTMISPPDIFSQVIISVCFIIMYEILLLTFITKAILIRQPIKTDKNTYSKKQVT